MTTAIYTVNTETGRFWISADLSHAAAPIYVRHFDDDDDADAGWEPTRYQTADFRHVAADMVETIAREADMGRVTSWE